MQAPLKQIFFLLLLAVSSHPTIAKSCETEDYEDGVCVPLQKCDKFKEAREKEALSAGQRNLIDRELAKCTDEEEAGLICCKRILRPPIARSFEDAKPLTGGNRDVLPKQSECGLDSADRIYHGNVTSLDQYPWLVLIKYIDNDEKESFKCGGSLISKRYVLTAAHCINQAIAGVRLGEWDLETDPDCVTEQSIRRCADPVIDVGIERISIHKNYTRRASKGGKIDMALLRLDREISFGRFVLPICLPRTDAEAQRADNQTLYVSGWGMTENDVVSTKKLFVDVNNVELDECRRKINAPLIKIDETMICALGGNGKDACQGDSGGPLMEIKQVAGGKKRFFLIGVVSKGLTCGSTKPGFYTDVYQQFDWIISNMELN
ncbi:phenoloxidase-activating factor 3-like [Topomyia yanbarensis]|uniref:phenoloxidase-activating factor 3-like n=1 Tax=Topomyia yanbarensis TaxID=2498891 RepID=UPI00273C8C9A|nr:phenoloxidase-activating factor 3-like [Topomyia yanbarensis]